MRSLFLLFAASMTLAAQRPAPLSRQLSVGIRVPVGQASSHSASNHARVVARDATGDFMPCDKSAFQAVEQKKRLGTMLIWGGGITTAGAMYAANRPNAGPGVLTLAAGGLGAAVVGYYVRSNADDPEAVDRAVQSLKIGETKVDEVRVCLGSPQTTTTRGATEEIWTYNATKSRTTGGLLGVFMPVSRTSVDMRYVSLTFKNGILADITKTASAF